MTRVLTLEGLKRLVCESASDQDEGAPVVRKITAAVLPFHRLPDP